MPERIFIGVAWPYANGPLHMGHIAGCYLAADIFARYHRLKGNDVLMVSGSDQHGTPITLRAEQDGVSPQEVVDRYHSDFLRTWDRLGISFDLFTTTGTDNHREVVQDIFSSLLDKGYIYTDTTPLPYCHTCRRFLPDRYVKGTCPHCANPDGRGDQCDQCGKPLNPEDLIDIQCRISGDTPEIRDSEHFFLKLSAFQEQLLSWVRQQRHWRPNVLNFTQRYLEDGLKDRAISRDLEWGVPCRCPATMASASTCGSRPSSATCPRRRSGPRFAGSRTRGSRSGEATLAATTSWGRTTSRSTPSSGPPCSLDTAGWTSPTMCPQTSSLPWRAASFPPAATGPCGSPITWTATTPTLCDTTCLSPCRRPATPTSPGVTLCGATTMSWWPRSATWCTASSRSRIATSKVASRSPASWRRRRRDARQGRAGAGRRR